MPSAACSTLAVTARALGSHGLGRPNILGAQNARHEFLHSLLHLSKVLRATERLGINIFKEFLAEINADAAKIGRASCRERV